MNESPKTGRVIGIEFEKKSEKKRLLSCKYTKDTFSMYAIWIRDFFIIHRTIYEYIGDSLEIFYNILDEKFFEWLNQPKNYSKFMFEIKKIFMDMADDILIHEIMLKKLKNPFLIELEPEERHIPQEYISEIEHNYLSEPEERHIPHEYFSESEYDYDIDYFSDPEPCYNLMEENHIPDEIISEDDVPNYDDNYYLSFFS
jgi:hypothetical protein